jgi:hypothetical protein
MRLATVLTAVMTLAGCATMQAPAPPVVDTYCLNAKKWRWSVEDTPETIRQAEVHNQTIDLRCGYPGKVASGGGRITNP